MVYEWKLPLYKIDPQEAGEELERIGNKNGGITPEAVVNASREDTAVLHSCFTWDDETAAERYRETEAQELIRNIVTVKVNGKETPPVRAFVSIHHEYKPVDVVMSAGEYTAELLAAARREMQQFRSKYAVLEQLASVFDEIDSALAMQE